MCHFCYMQIIICQFNSCEIFLFIRLIDDLNFTPNPSNLVCLWLMTNNYGSPSYIYNMKDEMKESNGPNSSGNKNWKHGEGLFIMGIRPLTLLSPRA